MSLICCLEFKEESLNKFWLVIKMKFSTISFLNIFFVCIYVHLLVWMCIMCMRMPKKPEEGVESSGPRIWTAELPGVTAGNQARVL